MNTNEVQKLIESACLGDKSLIDPTFLCKSVGSLNLREAAIVAPSTRVTDVIRLLKVSNRGVVLIVSGETLEGIFSERDAVKKFFDFKENDPIKNHMSSPVHTIDPSEPIAHAVSLMASGGFRHLPVVQNGVILGVISVRDILEELVAQIYSSLGAPLDSF